MISATTTKAGLTVRCELDTGQYPSGIVVSDAEMAVEFARLGVRVNAVAPGEIKTAMLSPETTVLLPRIPLNRLGVPSDVAGTIFFLCSEDAAYVTGTEISVNGGQHIY